MEHVKKVRLNLYLSKDIIEFAKKWGYVRNTSISRMVEEFFVQQQHIVAAKTPFQWISDTTFGAANTKAEKDLQDLEEYLNNQEEKEFCANNPGHPRAKMRKKLSAEHDTLFTEIRLHRKEREKELIKRWMESFNT